jgi:hypothetical protein
VSDGVDRRGFLRRVGLLAAVPAIGLAGKVIPEVDENGHRVVHGGLCIHGDGARIENCHFEVRGDGTTAVRVEPETHGPKV